MGGDRWGHGGDGGHVKGPGGQGAVRRGRQQPEAPPDPALPLRQTRTDNGTWDQGLGPPGRAANSPRRHQTQLCPCVRRGQIMGPGTRGWGPQAGPPTARGATRPSSAPASDADRSGGRGPGVGAPRPGRQQAEAPPDPALPLRQARTGQGAGDQGLGPPGRAASRSRCRQTRLAMVRGAAKPRWRQAVPRCRQTTPPAARRVARSTWGPGLRSPPPASARRQSRGKTAAGGGGVASPPPAGGCAGRVSPWPAPRRPCPSRPPAPSAPGPRSRPRHGPRWSGPPGSDRP
ncbi:hypothetical protein M2158_008768 [Streptomyces sp. SAI-144]|nr:hypothetical protein [Streptomyces sp. SAI-144]